VNFPKRCHKNLSIALLASVLSLVGSIFAVDRGPRAGQVNRELEMSVHLDATEVGQSKVPKFRVELRNAGEHDLILNLGIMLAAGRKQYPRAIVLIVTDSQGKARWLDLIEPGAIAGRVDPLIVPLPVGSTFSIPVDLDKYWAAASKEFDYKLKPGTYFLEAQFDGRGVTQQEANLDVKGIALMPYWTGSITSNRLRFEFSGR
jgi:hypothetical protein